MFLNLFKRLSSSFYNSCSWKPESMIKRKHTLKTREECILNSSRETQHCSSSLYVNSGAPSGSSEGLSAFLCAKLLFSWTHGGMAGRYWSLTTARITELKQHSSSCALRAPRMWPPELARWSAGHWHLRFVITPAGPPCYSVVLSQIGFQAFSRWRKHKQRPKVTVTNFNAANNLN